MFIGTLFTLFVIPSIYMLIARDHGKDRELDYGAGWNSSPVRESKNDTHERGKGGT